MRQVIRRFLKHLGAEKNASVTTIKSYNTISINSTCMWLNDWETDSFPEMSPTSLHCKGREVNILPLDDSAMIELRAYLKQRRRRNRTRALFISCRNRRISRGTVWYLVKKYLKKSRIKTHRMGPHALRHTFATLLLNQGENLRVIQSLMNDKCYQGLSTTKMVLLKFMLQSTSSLRHLPWYYG
jgi:site-specific recombinase XerD